MFNFQHSQITQNEFDKLAQQLLKYSSVYATSKFDVGKVSSSLHLPLKPDAVFKKQRASKVPIHLHDKVNRLLNILEQYEIISPVNKEEQPKGNTFINPVIILAKGESLKIVLDARYLNSLIDESKCNWPIEPIQVILTKINGKYFTTTDMNSAYNQMPLDEQSRRLTQFVIGNQQYEFNRLFYGISIGPAAFSAFMSKINASQPLPSLSTPSLASQVKPTYSSSLSDQSANNSPDIPQISPELENYITLQQQSFHPHTLTINHLSSMTTSSGPPTPTPLSDYTQSLAQSSSSTETSTSTNRAYRTFKRKFPNHQFTTKPGTAKEYIDHPKHKNTKQFLQTNLPSFPQYTLNTPTTNDDIKKLLLTNTS